MRAKTALQRAALALQGRWPFQPLFRLYYARSARLYEASARRAFPELRRLFLRRGQLRPGWVPGASDLDFGAVASAGDAAGFGRFAGLFWRHYEGWKRVLPILGEVQLLDQAHEPALAALPGPRLREFSGAAAPKASWERRWENAGEALFSTLHLLEAACLDPAQRGRPDFEIKLAKGCADAVRYARAAGDTAGPEPEPRGELEKGAAPPVELLRRALLALDDGCGRFIDDARRELGDGAAAASSSSWIVPDIDGPFMEWHGRLKELLTPGYPPIRGVHYDSVFRWIVVAEVDDAQAFERLAGRLASWPAQNSIFGAPAWILPPRAFQALLWTPHLGSPLFYHALSPAVNAWGVAARKRGRRALDSWGQRAQFLMKASDFAAPPPPVLRAGARLCVGSLALSLALFRLPDWAGDNAYRIVYLYSRLIAAILYLKDNLAADPDDLEALAALLTEKEPALARLVEEPLSEALDAPPERLNALSAEACFDRHYSAWRALLDAALDA